MPSQEMRNSDISSGELSETSNSDGDSGRSCSESERLSDINDAEIDSYLNNEKEKYYKTIIWEKLNHEYIQEQELKKNAAASGVPQPKKERQKKAKEVRKTHPAAQTSVKRGSSRIDYDVLDKLLDEPSPSNNSKRRKTDGSKLDQNVSVDSVGSPTNDDDENGPNQNDYDEDNWGEDTDHYNSNYNFQDEDYDDDYYEDDLY